jgi:hypothetical protein
MEIKCSYCDKIYASYQSRCNHIRRYHKETVSHIVTNVSSNVSSNVSNVSNEAYYKCVSCNKNFNSRTTKWRHEKTCKKEQEKEANEIDKIKKEMELLKSEFKKSLNNNVNSHQKIKNQTNNVNHGTIININGLGMESILPKLTKEEKIDILTSLLFKEIPAIELIRKIYNNDKFIEDRNTIINNLQSKTCLVYNAELEKFDAKNKNTHIEDMIDWRNKDIKKMMDEMKDSPKIKKYTRKLIEDYIDNTEEIKKTVSYKKYKEEIIYIIYNCKEFMKKLYNQQITNL